jgi:hypothetical protein
MLLDAAGVHEDADLLAHGGGREVGPELGADDTGVAVRAGDLAPDAADGGVVALRLGLVDVGDALPGVPPNLLLGVHPLDLQQRRVLVLVRLRPLVAEDGAADVQPHALALPSLHRRRRPPRRVEMAMAAAAGTEEEGK